MAGNRLVQREVSDFREKLCVQRKVSEFLEKIALIENFCCCIICIIKIPNLDIKQINVFPFFQILL